MPEPILEAGQILDGKYRIEAFLGQGGMGSVYRARHLQLSVPRAIKVMQGALATDDDLLRRFHNEAKLVAELRHPNIAALFDFSPLPRGGWYMVLELVEGESLRELLSRRTRFSPSEVDRVVGQVADALAVAHAKGILHRDVSPDNIMVTRDDEGRSMAKLLDFGLAKSLTNPSTVHTAVGAMFGKLGYAAPEQFGALPADGQLDARVDVFSLAVVAYEMLTGVTPFTRSDPHSYLHELTIASEAQIQARYSERLPIPFRTALCPALARERNERTSTILAFRHAVQRAARISERRPTGEVSVPSPEGKDGETLSQKDGETLTQVVDPDWVQPEWVKPDSIPSDSPPSDSLLYAEGEQGNMFSASERSWPEPLGRTSKTPTRNPTDATKPRRVLGWALATVGVLVLTATAASTWYLLDRLGEEPFEPPNVPSEPSRPGLDRSEATRPGMNREELERWLSPARATLYESDESDESAEPDESDESAEPDAEASAPAVSVSRGRHPSSAASEKPRDRRASLHASANSRLRIVTQPPSPVRIDGLPMGRTPLEVDLAPGSYAVLFGTWASPLWSERVVVRGGRHRLSRDFTHRGSISVTSGVAASISLGGNPPQSSPALFQSVPAGTHRLRAVHRGFEPYEAWVEVLPGDTTAVVIEMQPSR